MFINQILAKLKSLVYSKSETDSLLNGKASSSHTHTKSEITDFPTIPSKVSQLTNDSGFITSSGSCNYANSAGSAGSATTAETVSTSVAADSSKALVYSSMADNDFCRILVGGSSNAGYVEIATADDGNEPIYVRQYTGVFSTVTRTLTLLDGSGNTSFPGTVTASTFSGNLNGNCDYATNSGYTNWLRTSSHTDHLLHTEWDGSYFWTYVTAGDGGYRAVRVERSNSAGWADSAGGVAWGNVSDRPWAVSQFTNDSGFITSWSLMYINGDRAHNAYRIVYGSFNNWNNVSTGRCWVSFPNAFSSAPTVVMNVNNPDGLYNYQVSDITTTGFIAEIWDGSGNRTGNGVAGSYIAIGRS